MESIMESPEASEYSAFLPLYRVYDGRALFVADVFIFHSLGRLFII
jgi:hypothetical protein